MSRSGRARPNPVRGACTFEFALEHAGPASLEVFDANGRRVRTLVHGTLEPGVHSVRWDRTDDDGAAVRPGTYFVRLAGPLGRESRRGSRVARQRMLVRSDRSDDSARPARACGASVR